MEDDGGIKAPVTRLRRRLSVESEEVKSPAPSTPTKKRGGRLAAKPQLELIKENDTENSDTSKRTTRKSISKDKDLEPVVEKIVTPSRRSTRIKSNTSVLSESVQNFDSPRAKRAARRTSQIGSDNEAPSTPTRQTRRMRIDSTSSIGKQEMATKVSAHDRAIIKEEVKIPEDNDADDTKKVVSPKKSPRLTTKINKRNSLSNNNDKMQEADPSQSLISKLTTPERNDKETKNNTNSIQSNLSTSSSNLIKDLDTQPKKQVQNYINKSASFLKEPKTVLSKRHRTKSWTTLNNIVPSYDDNFFSDNEKAKKKISHKNLHVILNASGDHENILDSHKSDINSNTDSKNKLEKHEKLSSATTPKKVFNNSAQCENIFNQSSETVMLFEQVPNENIQSEVLIEDSDSNTDIIEKQKDKNIRADDQCVPVVDENLEDKKYSPSKQYEQLQKNDSCEPMDIDETIPASITLNTSEAYENTASESIKQKSLTQNNSKIKSSTHEIQTPNKSENKSTLILSQIKDMETSVSKSPKEQLSKSLNVPESMLSKENDKNLSLNYLTSTPLQEKPFKKLGMQINTSDISAKHLEVSMKNTASKDTTKKSNLSKASEKSNPEEIESDQEFSQNQSSKSFLDDEAEEASDDYESGDSREEDEKQYDLDNEIIEKGETLDSEEEYSNESDYEKDSFVVSSDGEDEKLLSGSGDDLSLGDNELSMSAKSKKKYNDRKIKEQKKASREMYQARHNLNDSERSCKPEHSSRQRLDSSLLDSSDGDYNPKKPKHQRLNSNSTKSDLDESVGVKKKKKTKRLSESLCEDEKEITVSNINMSENKDPLTEVLKQEPEAPQKDINISLPKVNENIEEVYIEENLSTSNVHATTDPLYATETNNYSSSSECEELMQNYDSVLNELNKETRYKLHNNSLNLEKKKKEKYVPIIDQLNLTQLRKPKKKDNSVQKDDVITSNKNLQNIQKQMNENNDDESSDSIDMKLLFPDSSNDSDNLNSEQNKIDFIPLKKSEAKTDIPGTMNNSSQSNSSSKKKRKSSLFISNDNVAENISLEEHNDSNLLQNNATEIPDDDKLYKSNFYLDTTGNIDTDISVNSSRFNSSRKKIRDAKIVASAVKELTPNPNSESLNISKKTNKKCNSSLSRTEEKSINESIGETSSLEINKSLNTSIKSSSKKHKKNKMPDAENAEIIDAIEKTKIPHLVSQSPRVIVDTENAGLIGEDSDEAPIEVSYRSEKNKKNAKLETTLQDQTEHHVQSNKEVQSKKRKRKASSDPHKQGENKANIDNNLELGNTQKVKIPICSLKQNKQQTVNNLVTEDFNTNKKRKRSEDFSDNAPKIPKENSFDKIHVSRLPVNILNQLEDKQKTYRAEKSKVVSTTKFYVEDTKEKGKKIMKPSNYLEESVYLNDAYLSPKTKKHKVAKNPKVLPFVPTAATSDSGFTTNFRVNVIAKETKFVAKSSNITNFKNDYLSKKLVKKQGTFEMFKKYRNVKLSKF